MASSSQGQQSSLVATIRFLRRWRTLIAVCAVLAPAVALSVSLVLEKQYSAPASLLFRESTVGQQLLGAEPSSRVTDPDREAATNVSLVSLPVVARRTAARFPSLSTRQLEKKIEVSPEGQSDVVVVNATDSDPRRAALIANTFATEYISFRRAADRSTIEESQRLLQLRLTALDRRTERRERATLRDQAQQLELVASLQTGNVEFVERAEPPITPSSPQPALNSALGLLLGLGVGVGIAFLLDGVDRRLRDSDEIEAILDRPLLGAIPESRALADWGVSAANIPPREREAFQMLRASLQYFNVDTEIRSVAITSPASGDGKSTVSWNLARAAAAARLNVLLVDADLRRGGLTADLSMSGAPGLSNVLSGHSFEAALHQVEVDAGPGAVQDGDQPFVKVLPAGPLPPNPTDLFASNRMREVLAEAQTSHDLVVLDTPPATVVSDAMRLVQLADGTVVVCRLGQTPLSGLTQLRDQLVNLDARVLGIVVNYHDMRDDSYAYGYGYGANGERSDGRESTRKRRSGRALRWLRRRQDTSA